MKIAKTEHSGRKTKHSGPKCATQT